MIFQVILWQLAKSVESYKKNYILVLGGEKVLSTIGFLNNFDIYCRAQGRLAFAFFVDYLCFIN